MRTLGVWLMAASALALISCGNREEQQADPIRQAATEKRQEEYPVRGVIRKITPEENSITIKHEEIPGYMVAMTMPFHIRDTNLLAGLTPGDAITFRLVVTDDESWIDQIRKVETPVEPIASPTPPGERPSVRIVRNVEPLEVGDLVPNYPFTNELGRAVSLHDFKGKAVALTFIFTRCPLPDFCPMMSKKFAEAYSMLMSRPNAPTNWHLLTISFDPHFDTPAVLKAYAERYNYDPERWSFVTGAMIEIDAITEQFNLPIFKQGDQWDHKLRTAVIDTQGRLQKVFVYNQWSTEELVDEIVKAAQVQPAAQETGGAASP